MSTLDERDAYARLAARLFGGPMPVPPPVPHPDTGEPLPTGEPVPLPPTPGGTGA